MLRLVWAFICRWPLQLFRLLLEICGCVIVVSFQLLLGIYSGAKSLDWIIFKSMLNLLVITKLCSICAVFCVWDFHFLCFHSLLMFSAWQNRAILIISCGISYPCCCSFDRGKQSMGNATFYANVVTDYSQEAENFVSQFWCYRDKLLTFSLTIFFSFFLLFWISMVRILRLSKSPRGYCLHCLGYLGHM